MSTKEEVTKKKKKKSALLEEESKEGKKNIKKNKKKKVADVANKEIEDSKKEVAVTTEAPAPTKKKKVEPLKDTSDKLPKKVADRKVVATRVGDVRSTNVSVSDITATSQSVYVDDIHHANPTPLQTIYWLILKNNPHVVVRVEKSVYENVVSTVKNINHLYTVVDCSVVPTLSYGSWKLNEINEFPTSAQIKEQDSRFKKNPTMVHNPPVKIELYEEEADDELKDTQEDDTFDFNEEDDDEFDFADDGDES